MLIDWFTVGAQVLNFLILVWLMKRFLYKPILHAIDAREKKIAAQIADADAKESVAQKERDAFKQKNAEFDQQRTSLLTQATDEAKQERQRLLEEAREAADTLSAKRQEALYNEAEQLNKAISRQTQDAVFAIARKALGDLATTELEERLSDIFIRRLKALDESTKASIGTALTTASEPARICSAFTLSEDQRAKIQNVLNETFSANIPLQFETVPDLVSGIELAAGGQKIAWSIADYLTSLEMGVGELLKPKRKEKLDASKPKLDEATNAQAEENPEPAHATQ